MVERSEEKGGLYLLILSSWVLGVSMLINYELHWLQFWDNKQQFIDILRENNKPRQEEKF